MTGSVLDPFQRAKAVRYLLLQWPVDEIARAIHCDRSTIYRMQNNLWLYGSAVKPHRRPRGCPFKMTKASEDLVQFLLRNPTSSQAEMAWFLWEECGIRASQPTISRFLKRIKWSRNFFLVGVAGRELFRVGSGGGAGVARLGDINSIIFVCSMARNRYGMAM
jgi:transposase